MSVRPPSVMPGLVPGIHAFSARRFQGVDGRNKCGHDEYAGYRAFLLEAR